MLRAATGFVDAADVPPAGVDGVVLAVLVDAVAKPGRAHLECHHLTLKIVAEVSNLAQTVSERLRYFI